MNFTYEVITSPIDVRDYHIAAAADLPTTFTCPIDLQIKNQGSKPTCVAHATASMLEYHYKKQFNKSRIFSTEFIYGFRDTGYYIGNGMVIRNALRTLAKVGDPYKSECPGNNDYQQAMENVNNNLDTYKELAYPHRISSYYRCNTEEEIKTALLKHGPVIASMNTYTGAYLSDDVYVWDPEAFYGRHCILIVGWTELGWIVQNSWGKGYGGDGKFILPYAFTLNEAWGISDDINDESVIVKKSNKFTSFLYRLWNAIANFFMKFKSED